MKNNKIYLLGACLLCAVTVFAQNVSLQPPPQQLIVQNKTIDLPAVYQLNGGEEANPHAVKVLKELLSGKQSSKKGMLISIGEKGDKSVRKYSRRIPDHEEGYYLSVNEKEIVLAGNDERGTYYALQTFAQLLKDGKLPEVEIKDYPSGRRGGCVKGVAGPPGPRQPRLSQLKFYGKNKMNTYIYGPKDDPYHSAPNWRLPYPDKEAAQLQELVAVANENEVDFVWAIHPGQDIKWSQEDRDLLLAKFEKMYQLGVRSFAVFFDDISGEGTNPQKQAELLNYIDEKFAQVKPDINQLVMCPTEYNKSWSNPNGNYLTTLGDKLNPSIQIMWTGDRVISDITRDGISWINERIKRPAYIWWNFPVSDYVRDHLLLGPVYGNDTTIAKEMSGFVTNPMEHAESSKIAIYSVASYAWNPAKYAFAYSQAGVSLSYTPWLRKLVNDIFLADVAGYWKLGSSDLQALSASLRYFSLGEIITNDTEGNATGSINPYEMAFDLGYSRKLSEKFSMGVVFRYIYSDLGFHYDGSSASDASGASAFSADIAGYYTTYPIIGRNECQWSWGFNISNIGTKISYDSGNNNAFLPTNLRLGTSFLFPIAEYNTISLNLDLNKLLVPTRPQRSDYESDEAFDVAEDEYQAMSPIKGIFKSFSDAPGGFKEELREINFSIGAEYSYNQQFFIRAGYFNENKFKGNRKFFSFGAGFSLNVLRIDAAYMVATAQTSPLDQTLRFTLSFDMDGLRDLIGHRR